MLGFSEIVIVGHSCEVPERTRQNTNKVKTEKEEEEKKS